MKIFVYSDGAGWVIDSIARDYRKYSRHEIVDIKDNPDIFSCIGLFDFPNLYGKIPKSCLSFVHLHHINKLQLRDYDFRSFNNASGCIVYNKKVEQIASTYIKIPIHRLSYWLLSNGMGKSNIRKVNGLKKQLSPNGELLIGSFQKDGSGETGENPKMSKGPDILVKILYSLSLSMKIKVVLAGYARQYVINELKNKNIPYVYMPKYEDINSLYDCLDWYLVTSRYEGGPQSILEASYRKLKILSTDVGIAPEILHPDCICNDTDDFIAKIEKGIDKRDYNYNIIVNNYLPQNVISNWDDFFERQYNRRQTY